MRLAWTTGLGILLAAQGAALEAPRDGTLERALTDAWVSGDPGARLAARERIAAFVQANDGSAHGHYLLGLAGLLGTLRTNAAPDNGDPERTLARLDEAQASLARALELDPGLTDASAAKALCIVQRFMLNSASPEDGARLMQAIADGKASAPERASVRLLDLWMTTSRSTSSPAAIDSVMEQFAQLAASLREELRAEAREPGLWDLFAQAMCARALLFSPRPRPRQAALVVEALLEQRPDFHMAKAFLVPFVTPREPLDPGAWAALEWTEVGVEVEADGALPGLPDAAAVSWAREASGALWIRVDLLEPPSPDVFGVNLVIDADGSDGNGSPWWGGDSDLVFDRLVSAWVARDDEGTLRGAVGVTDDVGALNGEMTNLGDGSVGFGYDVQERVLVLRVPAEALGDPRQARWLVAVGSNANWNDNLPDTGALRAGR